MRRDQRFISELAPAAATRVQSEARDETGRAAVLRFCLSALRVCGRRARPHSARWSWFLAGLLLTVLQANALVLQPLAIEELAHEADIVLQGTVLSKICQRDPAGRIYTQVQVQVIDLWKGAIPASPFTIVHGGGVLGEREAVVSGQVEYRVGEEVVVFLVRNLRGEGVTLGLLQGKFHVWKGANGATRYVVNPFHGVSEQAAAQTGLRGVSVTSTGPRPLTLEELKRRVLEVRK